MIPLLTDDEIVALAIEADGPWPVPLITVALDREALTSARLRGIRSLTVRGLIADAGPLPDFDRIIKAATSAKLWRMAIGVNESGSPLVGTSTYAFETTDSSTVVDIVTSDGTHRLSSSDIGDANDLFLALAKNVFDYGFAGDGSGVRLLVGRNDSTSWVGVSRGKLALAQVSSDGVQWGKTSSVWAPHEIARILGE